MSFEIPAFAALIAALVAWITYKNHQLAVEKHKLELFEKRFAVFRAAQVLLSRVLEDGGVKDLKTIFEYRRDTQVAFFLFGPDVDGHLKSLDDRALTLWTKHASLQSMSDGEERTRLALSENALAHELIAELSKLKSVFAPYLQFRTWH